MSDPVESLTDVIKDRLRNPFFGSWAIAFAIINWQTFYVLLFPSTELGFIERLKWVQVNLYSGVYPEQFWKIYAGPFGAACVAVSVIPWLIVLLDKPRFRASIEIEHQRQATTEKHPVQIEQYERAVKERDEALTTISGMKQMFEQVSAHSGRISENWQLERWGLYQRFGVLISKRPSVKSTFFAIHDGQLSGHQESDVEELIDLAVLNRNYQGDIELTGFGQELRQHVI